MKYKFKSLSLLILLSLSTITHQKTIETPDGQDFTISYDEEKERIKMQATVGKNKYFSVGLGCEKMDECDMVVFQAFPAGGKMDDTYCKGHDPPVSDS